MIKSDFRLCLQKFNSKKSRFPIVMVEIYNRNGYSNGKGEALTYWIKSPSSLVYNYSLTKGEHRILNTIFYD